MNIVYTLNDQFVPQVAASMCSVCANNRSTRITFYLIVDGVSIANQEKLQKFIALYGQKLNLIPIKDLRQYFDFDFDTTGWNTIVLARLVLDKLLPRNVKRVLYLDGDTIVRGDLAELYRTDMGQSVIAAGLEPTASQTRKQTLGIKGAYYNAGVLLIDLEKWRAEKTGRKILDYYAEHNGKLFANDQDAINGALKGEIYPLLPKYNFCNIYTQYPYRFLRKLVAPAEYFSEMEFNDSVKDPIIIHYLGEERPWRAGNRHQYRADYKKYLAKTPWKNTPDERGWQMYFVCWWLFNWLTKPFPALRYKVITSLIPAFINLRARKNRQSKAHAVEISSVLLGEATATPIKHPKVSILIPAYNAAKLVHKAIDSALAQTHPNIEVVIVNDGSTDDTWQVLQAYHRQYPQKVRIFSQQNRGLGATRNVLLEKAAGDYIVNLDADDWLKADYVATMLTALGAGDIAICGFERYDATYHFRNQRTPELNSYAKYRFCTTAGKMFRRDFLRKHHLHYEAINMGEDAIFNGLAYSKTQAIAVLSYSGYCCYESAHSMAHTAKYTQDKSFYMLMRNLVDRLEGSEMLHDPEFRFYVFKNLLMDVFIYKSSLSVERLTKIYRQSVEWYKQFLRTNHARFRVHFQKGEPVLLNLTVNGFVILTKLHLDGLALRILKRIPINIL